MLIRLIATAAVLAASAGAANAMPGRPLHADLRGGLEVPGPGKLDARGTARVRVNPGRAQVCYTVNYNRIPLATMAHIHRGAAGVAGPPVVTLAMPRGGMTQSCTPVPIGLAREMIDRPGQFYVNIHSQAFPNGAIRGQLHR